MIARLGSALCRVFEKTAPDPFVIAIALTLLTMLLALTLGYEGAEGVSSKAGAMIDSWRGPKGLWAFLGFGMQMSLILVTGHALAESRPIKSVIRALSSIPNRAPSAAALVSVGAILAGLLNWGLGLIVGALLAREMARALRAKGIHAHGALLAAAGYTGLLVWHGGMSGSSPLVMSNARDMARVLPSELIAQHSIAPVPLSDTLFSPMNLFVCVGLLVIVPITFMLLTPKHDDEIVPMPISDDPAPAPIERAATFPEWIDRSPIVVWALAILLVGAFVRFATIDGFMTLGPNEVNVAMLALGLVFHGSIRSYLNAAEDGAKGCAGIILQFPLYAGIMGIAVSSGLVDDFSTWISTFANETTAPLFTFCSAAVVNLFVPSGGGQWGIQGPIALQTGAESGVAPAKMIMSVAYGDQLTNMLQPFWALPLLAITKVKAREIVGYTCVVMVVAMIWMGIALLVF